MSVSVSSSFGVAMVVVDVRSRVAATLTMPPIWQARREGLVGVGDWQ
jgi:hypothetical protein